MVSIIDREQLGRLLPHSGSMCLLDQVVDWSEQGIVCSALSHRASDNPLRNDHGLPVEAGIEYAAQAMAIHGSLCEPGAGEPRVAYLAVLSRVQWQVQWLDDLFEPLIIEAERLMATRDGSNYQFQLFSDGELLLSGQAVVALQG